MRETLRLRDEEIMHLQNQFVGDVEIEEKNEDTFLIKASPSPKKRFQKIFKQQKFPPEKHFKFAGTFFINF